MARDDENFVWMKNEIGDGIETRKVSPVQYFIKNYYYYWTGIISFKFVFIF